MLSQTPKPRCGTCYNFVPDSSDPAKGTCELPPTVFVFPAKAGQDGDRVVAVQGPVTITMGCSLHSEIKVQEAKPPVADKIDLSDYTNPQGEYTCRCVLLGKTTDPTRNSITQPNGRTITFVKDCPACGGTGKPIQQPRARIEFARPDEAEGDQLVMADGSVGYSEGDGGYVMPQSS